MSSNKLFTLFFLLASFMLFSAKNNAIIPVILQVTVIDDAGNVQPNAKIKLFHNKQDFDENKNALVVAEKTNKKGKVSIKKIGAYKLEEKTYYIRVDKGDKNNIGHGIKTKKLEKKINKINVIISDL